MKRVGECALSCAPIVCPHAPRWCAPNAYFERAIFGLGNRIDVSMRARLFTGGTRRAIELRDRMCNQREQRQRPPPSAA